MLLAVLEYALDDIDPLIIKLWEINISQEYIDWVANLSAVLPNTPLLPPLSLFLSHSLALPLPLCLPVKQEDARDCDLCPIRIKGLINRTISLIKSFIPPSILKVDGTDGWRGRRQKHTSHLLWCKNGAARMLKSLLYYWELWKTAVNRQSK